MSYKTKFFEWDVSPNYNQQGVPVGYEFEFRQQSGGIPKYHLSTFRENAVEGAISYSYDGETWFNFPLGEKGKEFYTDYKMRVKITDAMSESIIYLDNGILRRVTGDGRRVIETFQSGLDFQVFSIDKKSNQIYCYYNKTLYCYYTNDTIRFNRSLNLGSTALDIIVDGDRGIFWQITPERVFKRSLEDASIISRYTLPSTVLSGIKTHLDIGSGNLIFSAVTSGFEIFELDFYSTSVVSSTSTEFITDIGKGDAGYFVTFDNKYIGQFDGTLDETYIDTGKTNVANVSGDVGEFYLISDSNMSKFVMPFNIEWNKYVVTNEMGNLEARGNDNSVIYLDEEKLFVVRDDGITLGSSAGGSTLSLVGQTNPSYSLMTYRAVYGEVALDQSSSSSSESSSSSSIDSSSSSSEKYSVSSQSQSTQSDSSKSSSSSEGYSESSSSSELYSESSSSSSEGNSDSSSEGNSDSSSGGYSDSSESFLNFSSSSLSLSSLSDSSQSKSSESIGNVSSSSESFLNESSSQSDGCQTVEIVAIASIDPLPPSVTARWKLNFSPSILFSGTACINNTDEGIATSGSITYEGSLNYSIGEVIEICPGECRSPAYYLGRGPCNLFHIPEACYFVYVSDVPGVSVGDYVKLDGTCYEIEGEYDYPLGPNNQLFCPEFAQSLLEPTLVEGPYVTCDECAPSSSSSSFDPMSESSSSEGAIGPPAPKNCSGDPDIIMRVTADSGDLPISWCGTEWVNEEADGGPASLGASQVRNGTEARTCPSSYTLQTTSVEPQQLWSLIGATGFNVFRRFSQSYTSNSINIKNVAADFQRWSLYTTPIKAYQYQIGALTGAAKPTLNDYRFANSTSDTALNPYFNSYTTGTITYVWRRGDNWPA